MPCYNEAEILPSTAARMEKLLEDMVKAGLTSADSRVCLVDDGSKDQTGEVIKKICGKKKYFTALTLSRNFGQQAAMLAGLFNNEADLYVTIDADLQDDPEVIKEMVARAEKAAILFTACGIIATATVFSRNIPHWGFISSCGCSVLKRFIIIRNSD